MCDMIISAILIIAHPWQHCPTLLCIIFSIYLLFSDSVFTGDLVAFFKRCKSSLNSAGMIFVKENIAKKSSSVDDVDHSVTR